MKTKVSEHKRVVPKHYCKTPRIINVELDTDFNAKIYVRETHYIVHVTNVQRRQTNVVEDIAANLREILS